MQEEVEDPLSRRTARLSICLDAEENPRLAVSELLRASAPSRRDSAVSLTSLNEEELKDASLQPPAEPKGSKRRRSSAQSFSVPAKEKSPPKVHKKKMKKASQTPSLKWQQSPEMEKRLPFKRLRDLILGVFTNKKEKWLDVSNPANIPKVVFCLVPGLTVDSDDDEKVQTFSTAKIKESHPELPFIYDNFDTALRSSGPGSKDSIYLALQAITNIPLSKNERKEILNKLKSNKITIHDLLMNGEQLAQHNYPMTLVEGYRETQPFEHEGSHIFAMDCEFCQSASGKELTRISLVNFQGEVVIDMYVKPEQEIIDYVTKYSGITEEKLHGVTTTLKDVQDELLSIVSSDDVLVGHSLESDLNVLKIKHSKIVDTAIIYEHPRGQPLKPSLKWLAQKYLVRNIQEGEHDGSGHSSVEDAVACLDLVKMKITEGLCHGVNVNEISIFQRLASHSDEFRSLWIDYSQYKEQERYQEPASYRVTREYVSNDDEAVAALNKHDAKFVVMSLKELEYNVGWSTAPKHYSGQLRQPDDEVDIHGLYEQTNARLAAIYGQLPANSMMIVYTALGSPREMYRLQTVKREFQKRQKDGEDVTKLAAEETWDFDKQNELLEACNSARESLAFIGLKQGEATPTPDDT